MVIRLGELISRATPRGKKLILVDWRYGQINVRLAVLDPETNTLEFYAVPTTVAEPVLAKALEEIQRENYIEIELMTDSLSQRVSALRFTGSTIPSKKVIEMLYEAKLPRNHLIIELDQAQVISLGDRYMLSQPPVNITVFTSSLYVLSRKYLEGLDKYLANNQGLVRCLIGLMLNPIRAIQLNINELTPEVIQRNPQSISTFTKTILFVPVDIIEPITAEPEKPAEPSPGSSNGDGGRAGAAPEEPVDGDQELKEQIKRFMAEVLGGGGE